MSGIVDAKRKRVIRSVKCGACDGCMS